MGKVEEISVKLTTEVVASMNDAVAVGDFSSLDQIVSAALVDWQQRREADLQYLRELIAEGIASGFEPYDPDSIRKEARERLNSSSE